MTAAVLGAAVLLTAGLFDAEPLYVPGVGLILLALAAELIVIVGARGASVRRELSAARVLEGDPLPVRWIAKTGAGPLTAATVEDAATDLDPVARISAGRRLGRRQHPLVFPRRGRVTLPPARLVIRDPLGLAQRVVNGPADDRVLVLPRPFPVRAPILRGTADAGEHLQTLAGAATEPDGLRPWQPGTPASRIFWPGLARGAGLIERRLVPESDPLPLVVLDAHRPDGEDELDAAVRATASLIVELARTGGCAVLLPGDRRATALRGLASWPTVHAHLAIVRPSHPPRLDETSARRPAVIWVRGRTEARTPSRATILVQPGELPGRRPAFSVAGCHAYAVTSAVGAAA